MMTIRINRAKGTHVALKMSAIVRELRDDLGVSDTAIAEAIGADQDEVDLLAQDGVFGAVDAANVDYMPAWIPKEGTPPERPQQSAFRRKQLRG